MSIQNVQGNRFYILNDFLGPCAAFTYYFHYMRPLSAKVYLQLQTFDSSQIRQGTGWSILDKADEKVSNISNFFITSFL